MLSSHFQAYTPGRNDLLPALASEGSENRHKYVSASDLMPPLLIHSIKYQSLTNLIAVLDHSKQLTNITDRSPYQRPRVTKEVGELMLLEKSVILEALLGALCRRLF